ncbi:hypothetical protein [Stenomitos frigidus]|nr:hypothetical protein [Stenomitos frigidus]
MTDSLAHILHHSQEGIFQVLRRLHRPALNLSNSYSAGSQSYGNAMRTG